MGSHLPREKPGLGDFKSPRDDARKAPARPRDPKSDEAGKPLASTGEAGGAQPGGATPFQLSRIYAKGWLAGMTSVAADDPESDSAAMADQLNPCEAANERARWAQGFTEAVARKLGTPGRKAVPFRLSTAS